MNRGSESTPCLPIGVTLTNHCIRTIVALLWLLSLPWCTVTISFLPGGAGQIAVLQDLVSAEEPLQPVPPLDGGGESQCRVRILVPPPPHVGLQLLHEVHAPQTPLTAKPNRYLFYYFLSIFKVITCVLLEIYEYVINLLQCQYLNFNRAEKLLKKKESNCQWISYTHI